MFKRGIRVCTGTGIGAALSTCIQSPNWYVMFIIFRGDDLSDILSRFLIWIGSDQERTFGPTISGLIHKHIEPERMILWDSKKRGGRPDTVKLLVDTWHSFGAEVIFITSNMQGNDEMMQGCAAGMSSHPPRVIVSPIFFKGILDGLTKSNSQPAYMHSARYGTSDKSGISDSASPSSSYCSIDRVERSAEWGGRVLYFRHFYVLLFLLFFGYRHPHHQLGRV